MGRRPLPVLDLADLVLDLALHLLELAFGFHATVAAELADDFLALAFDLVLRALHLFVHVGRSFQLSRVRLPPRGAPGRRRARGGTRSLGTPRRRRGRPLADARPRSGERSRARPPWMRCARSS